MLESITYDVILLVICALIGAIKSNMYDKSSIIAKIIDIVIGTTLGAIIALYVHSGNPNQNDGNIWLGCLIALTGGVLGSNFIEGVMKITPKEIKELLIRYLTK